MKGMFRLASFAALLAALPTLAACGGPDCESGTLVAALTYDAAAMTADTLRVRATINGQTMTASEPYTGQAQIRVPFAGVPYDKGLVVDVFIEARQGNAVVATAARSGYSLPATCAVLPLTFDETGTHFTISGQVNGVAGTGLTITDGTDTLPIAMSGAFSFPTQIASGQAYGVTVGTQPTSPTQVCTVMNGGGFIDDSDVTNVVVTCKTSSYTLSGTIVGLMSDGLQLELNSSQIVTLSQFGTSFSFPNPLDSGSGYTVTVLQPPTTQTCTFDATGTTTITGTVTNMDITDLNMTCVGS